MSASRRPRSAAAGAGAAAAARPARVPRQRTARRRCRPRRGRSRVPGSNRRAGRRGRRLPGRPAEPAPSRRTAASAALISSLERQSSIRGWMYSRSWMPAAPRWPAPAACRRSGTSPRPRRRRGWSGALGGEAAGAPPVASAAISVAAGAPASGGLLQERRHLAAHERLVHRAAPGRRHPSPRSITKVSGKPRSRTVATIARRRRGASGSRGGTGDELACLAASSARPPRARCRRAPSSAGASDRAAATRPGRARTTRPRS